MLPVLLMPIKARPSPFTGQGRAKFVLLTLALMAGLPCPGTSIAGNDPDYDRVISDSWRVNLSYGDIQVTNGRSAGKATTLSLTNGAAVTNDRGTHWDFEAGLGYTKTSQQPSTSRGAVVHIGQAELFTQVRRLFGATGWFMGWHIGFSRLTLRPQGESNSRSLETSLGLIAGWITPWGPALQLDAIAISPSPDLSAAGHLHLGYETLQYRGTLGVRF